MICKSNKMNSFQANTRLYVQWIRVQISRHIGKERLQQRLQQLTNVLSLLCTTSIVKQDLDEERVRAPKVCQIVDMLDLDRKARLAVSLEYLQRSLLTEIS